MKGTNVNLIKSQELWKYETCYMGSLVRDKIIHIEKNASVLRKGSFS